MNELRICIVVGKEGRITIPYKIREEHDIQEGDLIRIESFGDGHKMELSVIKK